MSVGGADSNIGKGLTRTLLYSLKCSPFDDIQLFRNKIFTFTKNVHTHVAGVTISFHKNARFIPSKNLGLYGTFSMHTTYQYFLIINNEYLF